MEKKYSIAGHIVENPGKGLPEEVFEAVSSLTPMVNVDLLFKDEQGRILLIWREDAVCGCGWHIPGGIIRFQETREERLCKTAEKELGTSVRYDPIPLAVNEIIVPQEVRGHFISFLYRCYLPKDYPAIAPVQEGEACRPGDMRWHQVCPGQWVKGQKEAYASLFEEPACTWPSVTTLFEQNYPRKETAVRIREGKCTFVFDIDGVVARLDESLQYDREGPLQKTIDIINRLYGYGNKIILLTARGYQTGIDWSEVTRKQLQDWKVCYHELKFGKPAADFYIDDKNMDLHFLYEIGKQL